MTRKSRTWTTQRPALWFGALPGDSDGRFRDQALQSGHGCFVRDVSGREYLDARAALWNASLGYRNRHVIEMMTEQLNKLPVAQLIRHDQPPDVSFDYAERLMAVLPGNLAHVRFCTTGAQAVEGAVLLSRFIRILENQQDRTEVLALWNGYHGIGGLASALTGERPLHEMQGLLVPGVHHVAAGDLDALRAAVLRIGPARLSAVIMEPVLGTDVVQLPAEYLSQVQQLCQAEDIHFILDEISTGFGRTGSLTVAGQLGLAPDMLLLSKGITAGYAPLSAIAVTAEVQERSLAGPGPVFPHGSTSDGHPLAMAAAAAVLDELADGSVLANVAARGAQLTSAIEAMGMPSAREVHGPGLMLAVELVNPDDSPFTADQMSSVKSCCREEGLLLSISSTMVILTPPLIITPAECDQLMQALQRGLRLSVPGQLTLAAGQPA